MIIDCHAHVSAPVELWAYKASLLSHRGSHGRGKVNVTDEQIRHAVEEHKEAFPHPHLHYIDKVGTNMQLISPRPFQLMHSEPQANLVQWFHEEVNNIIYRETQLYPDRFIGIAGIPTVAGHPLDIAINELERCVNELGFKGTLLNPDPYENSGTHPPALGDKYWYPLYEKLCELDVPAHIHGTGSKSLREPYSLRFINEETTAVFGLINSDVLKDFPDLKIVVSHGGGAMPYQLGRFQAGSMRRPEGDRFIDGMHKLYFDTVLYTQDAIELLLKVVGPERALFGAECPGVGSKVDPATGREMDDIQPHFHAIDFLSDADREMIFSGNAKKVFKLDVG
ncbi:MAG: amidohydrolase [Rhodospirillaceae bacterium]|jgi:OH-DDVA meta-cleavage compound hydrolase|nr:amidohydrolase [Rhodospirillaceae bacterium]MBT4938825.1 amidohydrolase [Rhodospirillaceae bacterium]MBT5941540.1 amidohydrolase [Rhodospirillaceae bacterium]MBT7268144.1 amidohydrolase [Rhodospirillaceae bacterium]